MTRFGSHSRIILPAVLLILLTHPGPAWANGGVPLLPAAFGSVMPWWMAKLTLGLVALAIVSLEAIILQRMLKTSALKGIGLSLVANLLSTAFGAALPFTSFALLLLLVLAFVTFFEIWSGWRWGLPQSLAAAILPPAMFIAFDIVIAPTPFWGLYGSLLPAFALTLVVEAVVIRRMHRSGATVRAVAFANVASYIMMVAVLLATGVGPAENPLIASKHFKYAAGRAARQGETEKAFELLREARRRSQGDQIGRWFRRTPGRSWETHGYYPKADLEVAGVFQQTGNHTAARRVLTEALEIKALDRRSTETLHRRLAALPENAPDSATQNRP